MFFERKKRCKYCASVLVDDKCTNKNCIAYEEEKEKQNEKNDTESA